MKKLFLIFVSILFFYASYAQQKCGALHAMAYVTTSLPGMMPVDENGNPRKVQLQYSRTIYLVTACDSLPKIRSVKYGTVPVKFDISKASKKSLQAGTDMLGNKVIMCEATDDFLWKIEVYSNNLNRVVKSNEKIMITGIIGKAPFSIKAKKEIQLEGLPSY